MKANPLLGLNFASFDQFFGSPDLFDRYLEYAREVGLGTIRVPLYWHRLQTVAGDRAITDRGLVDRYHEFLERLPSEMRVLGALLHAPETAVVRYFDDQTEFPDLFGEYVGFVVDEFSEIDDWELWNEPNASDFYMSVADGDGHRPWSPAEFLDAVVQPAATVIRSRRPDALIALPAFAENGLVGHRMRPPALSNRLPDHERFSGLRSTTPHGRFYFIPEFADGVLEELVRRGTDGPDVDAFALHPYPYFGIGDEPYWAHSASLVDDFFALLDRHGFAGTDVWITEVGCRSLDFRGENRRDERQQSAFVQRFPGAAGVGERISRLYWYKFNDLRWDLRQEKTFGLFDHRMVPRRASFHFRHLLRANGGGDERSVVNDRFEYGTRFERGNVDPQYWATSTNSRFSYLTPSLVSKDECELIVFPGRGAGDHLAVISKYRLSGSSADVSGVLSVSFYDPSPLEVSFGLVSENEASPEAGLLIAHDPGGRLRCEAWFAGRRVALDDPEVPSTDLERIAFRTRPDGLDIWLYVGDRTLFLRFPSDEVPDLRGCKVAIRTARTGPGRGQVAIGHVAVSLPGSDLEVFSGLASPEGPPAGEWVDG